MRLGVDECICYRRFIRHIIGAAKYIFEDTSAASKEDIDIFKAISDTGNFKISYTHDRFDDNNMTFVAEGKVIQDRVNRDPDDGTYEFVLLRLVDGKGTYKAKISLPDWKLVCEYISKEINLIRNDYINLK